MDILFCTSEAYPLVKTGGLADVSASLPRALAKPGNDVRLVLPAYPEAVERAGELTTVARLELEGADGVVEILQGRFPDSEVTLYLVDSPQHFRRRGNPYLQADGRDWPDNAERFALFARAIVAIARGALDSGWQPELVHCNDWQTGLVAPLLRSHTPRPAVLFTIHNLAYQGLFPRQTFTRLGLPATLWSMDGLEFHDQLSFLKGGLVFADWLSTVSPTYAREICTPAFGCGLDGLLKHRSDRLSGILNGMDCVEWNPSTDPFLERNYTVRTLQHKADNKAALQAETGLHADRGRLLLGFIGRLVEQKAIDLVLEALDSLFEHPFQLVVLGSGERRFETRLRHAAERFPGQLAVHIGYDEGLAHRIEAGADCLLMPSRYEPCGLNQLYSLRYGTVPIVHRTGGLADSVVDHTEETAADYTATGFVFEQDTSAAMLEACLRALSCFESSRVDWWKLVITGMRQDFCWASSAARYLDLYIHVCNLVRAEMLEVEQPLRQLNV